MEAWLKNYLIKQFKNFKSVVLDNAYLGKTSKASSASSADSATKASQDESGNNIKASYASSFSISGNTITLKNKNGASLGTVDVPSGGGSLPGWTLLASGTGEKKFSAARATYDSANEIMLVVTNTANNNYAFTVFQRALVPILGNTSQERKSVDFGSPTGIGASVIISGTSSTVYFTLQASVINTDHSIVFAPGQNIDDTTGSTLSVYYR